MQRARPNVGRTSVPMSGRMATRLSSAPQQQPQSFKPAEYGHPDTSPRTIDVPPPSTARPQAATPSPPRSGSRVVATVGSAGLIEAGQVTGTPPQPVQRPKPPSP